MMPARQRRKGVMTPAAGWVLALACLLAAAVFLPAVLIRIDIGSLQLSRMTAGAQASAINGIRARSCRESGALP